MSSVHTARVALQRARTVAYYKARHLTARPRGRAVHFGSTARPLCLPDHHYSVWKLLHLLGRSIKPLALTCRDDGAITWAWMDATCNPPLPGAINGFCTDISKSRVDEAMAAAFGYHAGIDPRHWEGEAVCKSEENTAHDGRIVVCPTEPEPGYVYQRLIDSRIGNEVEELRVVKVGRQLPFVYRKRRRVGERFLNTNSSVDLVTTSAVFDSDECVRLVATADNIGLDVGEFDVLRDADGRAYVIDINKTPWGPPAAMSWRAGTRSMKLLAPILGAYLDRRAGDPTPNFADRDRAAKTVASPSGRFE